MSDSLHRESCGLRRGAECLFAKSQLDDASEAACEMKGKWVRRVLLLSVAQVVHFCKDTLLYELCDHR
jgi:hypothetical protein